MDTIHKLIRSMDRSGSLTAKQFQVAMEGIEKYFSMKEPNSVLVGFNYKPPMWGFNAYQKAKETLDKKFAFTLYFSDPKGMWSPPPRLF